MISYTKATSVDELKQIMELQKINLFENLSEEERKEQGFVTVKHTLEILQAMNNACPHTIAMHNDKVVGFALSMTKDFADEIAILKPMFAEISKIVSDENYLVMGQICINKNYRKLGIFKGLYQFMKLDICKNRYSSIITEIDSRNQRSLNAHESVGFKFLKDFTTGNKEWRIVWLKV